MANRGQVVVFITGDSKDLSKSLTDAEKKLGQFGGAADKAGEKLTKAGKKMTLFATVPVAAAMGLAAREASNLQQSMGALDAVFGESRITIDEFANGAAKSAGLAKQEVSQMAAVVGAQLKGMGFETDAAADKTVELQKRAADMAATFGGPTSYAVQAISALLRGERDPIEKYGVSLKQADVDARVMALGLDTSTTASKKNAEAVASLDILMSTTADAAGQFAREQETAAGQTAIATAEIKNAAAELGSNLLPAVAKGAGYVGNLASAFGELPQPVQIGVLALAGIAAATGPILTVVGNVQRLKEKLEEIKWANTVAGAKSVGGALAVLSPALLAGAAIIADWAAEKEKAKQRAEEFTAALRADSGELGENTQALILNRLEAKNQTDDLARAGVTMEQITAAIGGNNTARRELIRNLEAEGEANVGLLATLVELFGQSDATAKKEAARKAIVVSTTSATEDLGAASDDAAVDIEKLGEAVRKAAQASISYEQAELALERANAAVAEAQRGEVVTAADLLDRRREMEDSAIRVADTERGVADAHRAVEDAQRGITDAGAGVVDAHERVADAAQDLEDAERGVLDAQTQLVKRQGELQKILQGYGSGSKEAASAEEELDDAQRARQHAVLDLTEAEKALKEARKDDDSTREDIRRAELRLEDARDRLEGATEDVTDAEKTLNETLHGQPAESDDAREAQERLEGAERALQKATNDVAKAIDNQSVANRGLEDAQRATETAARDLETAERAVETAVRDAHRAQEDRAAALRGDESTKDHAEQQRDLRDALLGQKEAYIAVADAYVDRAVDVAEANGKTLTAEEKTRLWNEKLGELAGTLAADSPLRQDLLSYVKDIEDAAKAQERLNEATDKKPGGGLNGSIRDKIRDGFGDGPGAVGGAGTAYEMAAQAAAMFGGRITSGYRTPQKNASVGGSPSSFHIDPNNPAQDIAGPDMQGMFDFLAANYGGQVRELIYGNTMIRNGKRMRYPANDHWDHVHVAHDGGTVSSSWPTLPGLRADERPVVAQIGEHIIPKGTGADLVPLLEGILAATQRVEAALHRQTSSQVRLAKAG